MDDERWIYISPHLDDAVLSCGGAIYEQTKQGKRAEIWTICAGEAPPGELSPLTQVCHLQWGTTTAEETISLRRGEDQEAAALVGASTRHFDIPDCIYRRNTDGELLYTMDVFGPRHPVESELEAEIALKLSNTLLPGDILICPLGIGHHLDHLLTRAAVERLGRYTCFYADIPYLFNHPEELLPNTQHFQPVYFPISKTGLRTWQAGFSAYRSQIKMLFESEKKMQTAIHDYWAELKGIQFWQGRPVTAA